MADEKHQNPLSLLLFAICASSFNASQKLTKAYVFMHAGSVSNGSNGHQPQCTRPKGILPGTVIVAPEVKVPFSLSQVEVFLAVARTGSTTSASLARCISQPAVSKSLSGLEQVWPLHN